MPRRVTLNSELGATDRSLRKLLEENESESADKIKRNLVKIIKNELTSRQSQIIMLYYFKEMNINEIAQTLDISPAQCQQLKRYWHLPRIKNQIEYLGQNTLR